MLIEQVLRRFRAGRLSGEPERVPGGLSNEMWRVVTDRGVFAVKRMVVNAENPGFAANVEASFRVEQRAAAAGVAMPRPVPCAGRALAEVGGSLFRMHEWMDGRPGADDRLLALDWDAAGPVSAAHEAAGLALDWSAGDPAVFGDAGPVAAARRHPRRPAVSPATTLSPDAGERPGPAPELPPVSVRGTLSRPRTAGLPCGPRPGSRPPPG